MRREQHRDGSGAERDNLTGPTIYLDQTRANSNVISRCRIWATPTGANPGNAGIQISCTPERNGQQHGFDKYSARGWVIDATTYGSSAVAHVDSDSSLAQLTLPQADVLPAGRTGEWRAADLAAPWTGTLGYRIMGEGWVQLRGSAQSPTGAAGRMFVPPPAIGRERECP